MNQKGQFSVIKTALLLIFLISVADSLACPFLYQVAIYNVKNKDNIQTYDVCGADTQVVRMCLLYWSDGNNNADGDDVTAQNLECKACPTGGKEVIARDPIIGLTLACATASEIVQGCTTYRYSTNNELTCDCNIPQSLVPLSDGSKLCTKEPTVQGCTLYNLQPSGEITCVQCERGYIVANAGVNYNLCTQTQVPNCLIYEQAFPTVNTGEGYPAVVCKLCQNYADNAVALAFTHPLYSSPGVGCPKDNTNLATQCSASGLVLLSSGLYACGSTVTSSNCLYYTSRRTGGVDCARCARGYEKADIGQDDGSNIRVGCVPTGKISSKCSAYYYDNTFGAKNYECIACKSGYTLYPTVYATVNRGLCSELKEIQFCESYRTDQLDDLTLSCKSGQCPNRLSTTDSLFCSIACQAPAPDVTETMKQIFIVGTVGLRTECVSRQNIVSRCQIYANQFGECSSCQSGYELVNITQPGSTSSAVYTQQACAKRISNCQVYDGNDLLSCAKCSGGLSFDKETRRCSTSSGSGGTYVYYCAQYIGSRCTRCIPSYTLVDQTCVLATQNCRITLINGQCQQCNSGYELVGGVCQVAVTCYPDEYRDADGICRYANFPNCGQFNQTGVCLRCADGFRFTYDLRSCVSTAPDRVTCPPSDVSVRYQVNNGQCIAIALNCRQSSYLPISRCYSCIDGYYLYEKRCYPYSFGY